MVMLLVAGEMWPAVVDSGFNGDLELPEPLREILKARFLVREPSLLAGGMIIYEDLYEVHFPFDGETVHAEASFVPARTILIGTYLMRRHRLTIDFVAQTVLLQHAG
jgi:predicted aspartyl protease